MGSPTRSSDGGRGHRPLTHPHLLLVEDDEDTRELMALALGAAGFSVHTAGSGREALARLAESEYDLLVTDYDMPGMTGTEMLKIAQEQDRVTGDYTKFWQRRNYLPEARRVRASVMVVHGLNDWNVKMTHVEQWYSALKKVGAPHKIWLHQSGHTDADTLRSAEWRRTLNRWFTQYLWGHRNGIDKEPKATLRFSQ